MDINLRQPLDANSPTGRKLLADLQGNILKGHGRDYAMHLFICFGTPKDQKSHAKCLKGARKWIRYMVTSHVTTAADQEKDKDRKELFNMLMLSSQGYEFLGECRPRDAAFRDGMRERRHRLNDPHFQHWAPEYKLNEDNIHALVIVAPAKGVTADKATKELNKVKERITNNLATFGGSILVDQRGNHERNEEGHVIEHFGFVDGVSQPQFIYYDKKNPKAKEYDQYTPLKRVLEEDRHGDGGYGSFFVYRMLEQNVETFNAAVENVAKELKQSPELVGAMAVGRFKNGTPLTTHGTPDSHYSPNTHEDFDYDGDKDGNKCPCHAHIRKVNPRGSIGFIVNILAREQKRRITRRGITYRNTKNNTVGLIFMCFQSDIKDQFEFMQKTWANNHNFSERGTGLDPIVGQDGGPHETNDYPNWPTGYNSKGRKRIQFNEHVKFIGGEYFFAPSIRGLKNLAKHKK